MNPFHIFMSYIKKRVEADATKDNTAGTKPRIFSVLLNVVTSSIFKISSNAVAFDETIIRRSNHGVIDCFNTNKQTTNLFLSSTSTWRSNFGVNNRLCVHTNKLPPQPWMFGVYLFGFINHRLQLIIYRLTVGLLCRLYYAHLIIRYWTANTHSSILIIKTYHFFKLVYGTCLRYTLKKWPRLWWKWRSTCA